MIRSFLISGGYLKALEPFSYTIPEDVFIDDNGIESLHFEVEMANGDPWPEYLDFDPQTRTLSGMFSDLGQLYLKITVTDQEGFQLSDRFYLEANTFTGTESECLQRAVSLAPNPAFGLVTIQGVEAARVKRCSVLSASGQLVKQYDSFSQSLDISSLAKSVYYICLQLDTSCVTKKLVVQ